MSYSKSNVRSCTKVQQASNNGLVASNLSCCCLSCIRLWFPISREWSNCCLCISQLKSSQNFLKVVALINGGDTSFSACDVHAQKLLNISEISAFPFSHKESFPLFDKFFVLAKEHSIIYIDHCHNQSGAILAHEDPSI